MLEAALRVVEAAREMRLVRKEGRTLSELPVLELALAIEGLRVAIEAFDRDTSESSSVAPEPKPDWASPPQMDDEGYRAKHPSPSSDFTLRGDAEAEDVLDQKEVAPEPVLNPPKERAERSIPEDYAMRIRNSANAGGLALGVTGILEGDEYADELTLSLDTISEKLQYAAHKVGWNPRLRALAEAARRVQNNLHVEMEDGGRWVRVPAAKWGALSVAIAEAALDQDVTIAPPRPASREPVPLPSPKPRSW